MTSISCLTPELSGHSFATGRHLLMQGIPINHLFRWLGHASITPTLAYLELVPDPTGNLAAVP